MRKSLIVGLFALMGWSGCSTDFEVAGEYAELAIVYGLLDMDADTQFIRIQKAFLGELDAADMAQTADSSYFGPEVIMSLNEYDGNDLTATSVLDTISVYTKDEGEAGEFSFFAPKQRLYYTDMTLNSDREYELLIVNPNSGYRDSTIVTASGDRVKVLRSTGFDFTTPSGNNLGNSKKVDLFLGNGLGYRDYTMRFDAIPGALVYEVWLHFDYQEERTVGGVTELTPRTLSWLVQRSSYDEEPAALVEAPFNGESWFRFVGSSLQPEAGLVRRIGMPDGPDTDNFSQDFRVEVIAGGRELKDYLEINAPSNSGALTDKPAYSTMAVGRGFISSRSFQWHPGTIHLGQDSRDELMGGQFTDGLGFGEY